MVKQGSVTYSTDGENEVCKMFITSWKLNRAGRHTTKSSDPYGYFRIRTAKPTNHSTRSDWEINGTLRKSGLTAIFSTKQQYTNFSWVDRPIRLTQCCAQFKSLRVRVFSVFHLHDNVEFTLKWVGNTWNKTFYSQRIWRNLGTTLSLLNWSIDC